MIILQQLKNKIKSHIKHCNAQTQYEFYQHLYDGEKTAAVRSLFMPRRGAETELLADYRNHKVISPGELVKYVSQYDIISFDIFDTLLLRTVDRPEDVFSLVEQKTKIAGFAQERIRSERMARDKAKKRCNTTEVTLDDIYKELRSRYGTAYQDLQQQEIQTEFQCCYDNPVMLGLLKELKCAGKRIIAVSDMYLPKAIIVPLLAKCGLPQFEEVYVSCEYGVGKADGRLFQVVRDRYPNSSIVHIGDNYRSDAVGGRDYRVDGIQYLIET